MAVLNKLVVMGAVYYFVGPIPLTLYGIYKYLGNHNVQGIIRDVEIATTIGVPLCDFVFFFLSHKHGSCFAKKLK
jgi:hypothetical protein